MEEVKQVSLNGIVFYIEKDGYAALKKYIDNLEYYYAKKEDGKEIIEDIQIRFAELLLEKRSFQEQAITLSNVEEVIAVLGYPENFEAENRQEKYQAFEPEKKRKRLYRDPENARIAGVCSGLSYYVGIDAWVFRLIFICLSIFSFGFWVLVYLILWFVIPQAETTVQRYEMKGEPLNIEDLEQKVKNSVNEAGRKVKKFVDKNSNNVRITTNEISSTAKNILKFIAKIFGVCLIFFSICAIATIISAWFFPVSSIFRVEEGFSIFYVHEIFSIFGLSNVASILCLICILLPLAFLLLLGISFFATKMKKTMFSIMLGIFIMWIVLSVFVGIGIVTFVADIETNYNASETTDIKIPTQAQTIVIKPALDKQLAANKKISLFGKRLLIASENNNTYVYGITRFNNEIAYTNDSNVVLRINKDGFEENQIKEVLHSVEIQDSIVYIPATFLLKNNHWRGEKINVQLLIPKGKKAVIDESFVKRGRIFYMMSISSDDDFLEKEKIECIDY